MSIRDRVVLAANQNRAYLSSIRLRSARIVMSRRIVPEALSKTANMGHANWGICSAIANLWDGADGVLLVP